MDNLRREIGLRIFAVRKKLKLRQETFGQKIGGKSKAAISKYENGETYPPIETLLEIADIGGVSLEYLLTGKVPENIAPGDSGDYQIHTVNESTTGYSPEIEDLIRITRNNPLIKLLIPGMNELPADMQLELYERFKETERAAREKGGKKAAQESNGA